MFVSMVTQWHFAGFGPPVGLRYEALPVVMRACGLRQSDTARVFGPLRVLEQAALEEIRRG